MANETTQVIYSMNKVGHIVTPNKRILRDISLGISYGTKIIMFDLNGADHHCVLKWYTPTPTVRGVRIADHRTCYE